MNTKIGTTFGLASLMVIAAIATMFAMGFFGPSTASAAAPTPTSMTASPSSPGDVSSIQVKFEIDAALAGNSGEFWIAFDAKYGVPTTIPKSSISIASGQTTGGVSNPLIDPTIAEQIAISAPLSVGDTVVKIQLGDTAPNSTGTVEGLSENVGGADHAITFATSAGITLPTAASTKEIYLSKDLGVSWSSITTVDVAAIAVIRELKLSAVTGARGKSVTATGKGFTGTGNATLWIDTNGDDSISSGEHIIASNISVSGGKFEHTFVTDTNFPIATNPEINAQGGDGNAVAGPMATFVSYGSISLDKSEVARGGSLVVTSVDFAGGTISGITIGGQAQVLPTDVIIAADVDEGFTIAVHASTPLGTQKIAMTSSNEGSPTARYTTVSITGAPVTVSPATAVANQEVTVTGTGFTKNSTLATITVGGEPVTVTSSGGLATTTTIASVETDSSGNFSTSFLIPNENTTRVAGSHTILVTDAATDALTGEVAVTVPGRTLTLDTDASKRGSEVTVTGTGYEAKGTVAMSYLSSTTSTTLGSATADSYGEFTTVVTIPNTPGIPSTNTITGAITGGGSKTVTHSLPASVITVDVAEQSTGEYVTITGSGFPAYAAVSTLTIGGLDVRPTPAPSTDVDGGFTSTVMVPGVTEGNHTVKVTASGITGSLSLKVKATTAVVIAVSTATADVFGDIIAADNLVRVWRFDNASQEWSFYDPRPAFASANSMDNTASGDIVWVNVIAEVSFQDGTLFPGWNLISLN
jgi:hypothetical protein